MNRPILVLFPILLLTELMRVVVPTIILLMDVRTRVPQIVPQALVCFPTSMGFGNVVSVSKFARATWQSRNYIEYFGCCHVRRRGALFSEYRIGSWIILHCITTSSPILNVLRWHKSINVSKWTVMPSFFVLPRLLLFSYFWFFSSWQKKKSIPCPLPVCSLLSE